jgi:hypothetical protein
MTNASSFDRRQDAEQIPLDTSRQGLDISVVRPPCIATLFPWMWRAGRVEACRRSKTRSARLRQHIRPPKRLLPPDAFTRHNRPHRIAILI